MFEHISMEACLWHGMKQFKSELQLLSEFRFDYLNSDFYLQNCVYISVSVRYKLRIARKKKECKIELCDRNLEEQENVNCKRKSHI